MEEFLSDTTIHGVEFFTSKSKNIRKCGVFVFCIAFCGLGLFLQDIFVKFKVNPQIIEEANLVPASDFPFPAVTICSPLFTREQKPNLMKVLKNPGINLTSEEQKHLAANIQGCAPDLGETFSKIYPNIDVKDTVNVLSEKFLDLKDFFIVCGFRYKFTYCEKLFNYVLTDHGFCFTYNLLGFHQIFNSETISEDFSCYTRMKIAKTYSKANTYFSSYEPINGIEEELQWTLEKGYSNDSLEIQPTRASMSNMIAIRAYINISDFNNLCPDQSKLFSLFLHMPNEILTPFHDPIYVPLDRVRDIDLTLKVHITDRDLLRYSPFKRGCYFEDEKPLKFFKFYTKAQCEFECLANRTLEKYGCVKFSMPRNNSTPICGLNQTTCYLNVKRNWSRVARTCKCLHSCTFIKYDFGYSNNKAGYYDPSTVKLTSQKRAFFTKIVISLKNFNALETNRISTFATYDVFNNFGSVLGIFFGCSVLTMMEVFFFIVIALKKWRFNHQAQNDVETTENASILASESTIHGFQFIFDKNRSTAVRIFWILTFLISLTFCLINARGNYIKLMIEPEIEEIPEQKLIHEIPFPSIKFCSNLFAKDSLDFFQKSVMTIRKSKKLNLSSEELNLLIASAHMYSANQVEMIQEETNFSKRFDIISYVNQTCYETDEILFDCEINQKTFKCSKLFKRILSKVGSGVAAGFCYVFNQENFHSIFNDKISNDFDSYGRGVEEKSHWTLDNGYKNSEKFSFPVRASVENQLTVNIKIPHLFTIILHLNKPNDVTSSPIILKIEDKTEKVVTISAKVSTYSQAFRKYLPENRGCYFTDERKLKFFKSYTEQNCLEECLSIYILNLCNCTGFYMYRTNSTPICIFGKEAWCYFDGQYNFPTKELGNPPCGCLKTCNDIEYKTLKEKDKLFHKSELKLNEGSHFVSRIKFKFTETLIDEDVHLVGYDFKDFLTDVGGLLGLFLGCSTVSVIELFYHPLRILFQRLGRNQVRNDPRDEGVFECEDRFEEFQEQFEQMRKESNEINLEREISEEILTRCFGEPVLDSENI